ncbi:hypothetical protein ZOSMA_66G00770 [Zostera marina]|uniref:Uncharacterized protein n=1 Tax=Zostera marina TaxID=29655 RepID=A0A0K9NUE4_ZOSMR|nr:hypothetical protein ZOSMA_66G00770 [Zostera marina]
MVFNFPHTRSQLAATLALFTTGAALFSYGAHLSFVNIEPQQNRVKARSDFVKDYLRRKYGSYDR